MQRISKRRHRWRLWMDVVGARNLENRQTLDAYCVVRCSGVGGTIQRWRSETVASTMDPEWNCRVEIVFPNPNEGEQIQSPLAMRVMVETFNEKNFFFDMFPESMDSSHNCNNSGVTSSSNSSSSRRVSANVEHGTTDGERESDDALGAVEIDIDLLRRRAERGITATDQWYLLDGVRTGEIRIRTVLCSEPLNHKVINDSIVDPLQLLNDQLYQRTNGKENWSVYDHYGFRIPSRVTQEWIHLRSYQECREQRRVNEWETVFGSQFFSLILPNARATACESAVVKRLAREGIPRHWRQRVYMAMSGAREKQENAAHLQLPSSSSATQVPQQTYYRNLVQQIEGRDSIPFRQIELDIERTFGHSGTTICTEEGRAMLRRVLKAYSIRNPSVGYCQGLNFIVGFMMLLVDEESAFWLLAVICEDLYPGYYIPTMADTQTDMLVLKQLIAEELPHLDAFTAEIGLPLELLGSQWLLCLFTTTFPSETVFRVFDCILTEGSYFVFPVIIAHLRRLETQLLGLKDFQSVLSTMKEAENSLLDADEFIRLAVAETVLVNANRIALLREQHFISVRDEMQRADRARALNRQLAVVYQIPAFSSSAARLLRFFHEEAEVSSRADVAFLLTLLCHGLVWLAEHSKHLRR